VVGHWATEPHSAPPDTQVPPWIAGQLAVLAHDFRVQAPPPHWAVVAQTVAPSAQVFWLQVPWVHCAVDVHTNPAGLLHWPQTVASRQNSAALLLQLPADGQSESLVQVLLGVRLQVPPRMAQSLGCVQSLLSLLQWPSLAQSETCMQLVSVRLQRPGCGVQSEFCVQLLLVWMLQVPGLGVQFCPTVGVQGFSGSGGRRLQPGGS
jgi:hypothetical protein